MPSKLADFTIWNIKNKASLLLFRLSWSLISTTKRVCYAKASAGSWTRQTIPSCGAPLSDSVNEFLQSVNIPIRYGYGLSEATATVCFFPAIGYTLGSIGTIMPEVEVKIDPSNSEILVKGKTVTAGYFKKPEANEKAFTEDGWFRTGDAGRLEGDVLYFTERIKDLYKTSNGKYIAPQAIEMLLGSDKIHRTNCSNWETNVNLWVQLHNSKFPNGRGLC